MAATERRPAAALRGARSAATCATVAASLAAACILSALPAWPVMAQGHPAPVALTNAGFESTRSGASGNPEGWWSVQHAGDLSYRFELDRDVRRAGEQSLRISNVGREPFGSIYQTLPAAAVRGRTVRLAAWLRTEEATGNRFGKGAALKLQAMKSGYPIAHNHGKEQAATGTGDWALREITLAVPPDAEQLELGVTLFGPGKVWADEFVLTVMPTENR